ncbi:Glucan 1,3-beta-glucosidase 3; AltName: Full=Exo-1,3-beta-glucanase 3 [Serendipita indica DSM 11827]|nr:Glucan 1,3-beta-glucosidase 3; AltName: Full=Exo-1,3-beta-glucanase 3 [Serendipita indica DSM 11827]
MSSPFAALRTPKDVYRYRKQRGVNLGSWFVLERWITPSPFRNAAAPGQSDLHIAQGQDARKNLEEHWGSWINDEDWRWIIDHGYNSVRIPVGYYHLCGVDASVIQNTDFAPYQNVFEGAWAFIDRAIQTAAKYHIGVLLDLHAAPGAQNPDAHSGVGNAQVKIWDGDNANATVRALRVLIAEAAKYENVVGIELLNEPNDRDFLPNWYASTIDSLRSVSADLPIYIADAWHSEKYIPWASARQDFVVVDQHLYRCFTEEDRRKWGDQHAAEIRDGTARQFKQWSKQARGNFIVGEFSAALGGQPPHTDAGEHDRQRRVFAQAELAVFEESCGGWFFWTLKKEEGWDAGWSLKNATRAEIMPAYVGKRRAREGMPNDSKRDQVKTDAYNRHVNYWKDKMQNNEHWRFEMGFLQGWNDGKLFFTFSGETSLSEIGYMGEWLKRRVAEHVSAKGSSDLVWEYEHGFQQGYATILGMM